MAQILTKRFSPTSKSVFGIIFLHSQDFLTVSAPVGPIDIAFFFSSLTPSGDYFVHVKAIPRPQERGRHRSIFRSTDRQGGARSIDTFKGFGILDGLKRFFIQSSPPPSGTIHGQKARVKTISGEKEGFFPDTQAYLLYQSIGWEMALPPYQYFTVLICLVYWSLSSSTFITFVICKEHKRTYLYQSVWQPCRISQDSGNHCQRRQFSGIHFWIWPTYYYHWVWYPCRLWEKTWSYSQCRKLS